MAKAVKLIDIAKRVGVSTVTVSKALADQKGVSEELRAKIKKIADEMGYSSPSSQRMQEDRKSYNVGVLVSSRYFNKTQSFYWLMYQELATKALDKNCFTMLEVVSEEDELALVTPKLLDGNRINGLIIIGMMKDEYLEMVNKNASVPVAFLDFHHKGHDCDCVVSDSYNGMYHMTECLCSMGHRKIAYVGTLFATDSITDRYFGYCKALYEYGIDIRKDYVIKDRDIDTSEVLNLSELLPGDMPTAFVCNCDLTAVRLIEVLNEKGYKVPKDVSVVGFDDYVLTNGNELKLTTYAVDVKEMVKKVISVLVRRMDGNASKKGMSVIEGHMVIGQTSDVPFSRG